MVKYSDDILDRTFAALADRTRRKILHRLAEGPASMGDLARPFDVTWPAVTKHVKVLERARLVRREQDGRIHRVHLAARPMKTARSWIDQYHRYWEQRFDALERYLDETTGGPTEKGEDP
jgi:DNA-binding transcriptional ArsR family regulator